jgi:hypothetical protein
MKKDNRKLFIVKKYIMATSASDAIRKEKTTRPDDVWVDEDWKKGQMNQLASAIGFEIRDDED